MASNGPVLAFGALGAATLFVVSGLKGQSIADVLAGKSSGTLDPSGGIYGSATGLTGTAADVATAKQTPKQAADAALSDAQDMPGLTTTFDGIKVATWIAPILTYARAQGWKGKAVSGFRTYAQQAAIYASGVRPAAKPGTSNHEGAIYPRGAVDVTEAAQLSAILLRSKYAQVLVYAGAKDPVHFSHPHGGSY